MRSDRVDVLSRIVPDEDRPLTGADMHPSANGHDDLRDEKFSLRTRLLIILGLSLGLWVLIGSLASLFL